MKVCLYFEAEKLIQTSGIGRAFQHQKLALELVGVETCTDPEESYDILHINTYGFSSQRVVQKAKERNIPVIYHAHSTEEDFRNSFILSNQIAPYLRRHLIHLYSMADHIITPTPYTKRLLEQYGIQVPITPISNGIKLNRFVYDEEKVKAFRRYFGLSEQDKVIVSVGLYFERKGISDFMEIAKHFKDINFIWFGHTPLMSIPAATRHLISHHPDNVILPGYVRGPIIEGAFMSADLFLFASLEETEGIVVLEALAARCPLLIRDIPVYADWLEDKVHVHKAQTVDEFCARIEAYYEDILVNTVDAGYTLAQARSLEEVGKQLLSLYTQVRNQI